ncbi:MAG: septum formation initiator family protein [bacterium]
MEFQEKRKIKRFFYSRVTLVCLIILIFLLLKMVWNVYEKQALTKDNLAKTATSFEGLQAREKMLSSGIDRLKTDSGIEQEIREKYGLVKPGEEVIVIVDGEDGTSSEPVSSEVSFWQKVKDWLK